MTTPVFVLRDDAGKLHSCEASAERIFCYGAGPGQIYHVADSKLTIGEVKNVDIKDKTIVLIDTGENGSITTARAFSDVAAFTDELRPNDKSDGYSPTTPSYDIIFGVGMTGQNFGAPATKASNFSYITGIEIAFGGKAESITYEKSNIADAPPEAISDEPTIIDVEIPVVVAPKPRLKVDIPTKPKIAMDAVPLSFKSESLFDTASARIKDDGQLADYVGFLVTNFKDSTDVIKIRLVGKADSRGSKLPDRSFTGNDKLALERSIAVQLWFSHNFRDSKKLDADTKTAFEGMRYVVFTKGTSEDLPVVLPVDIADGKAPQTIPWDNTIAGNTLARSDYDVSANAEMEKPEQKKAWYAFKNGRLNKMASVSGATHLLFALKSNYTHDLDWFVEDLDLNRVVNPSYTVVDETDAVFSEHGFDTKPAVSQALANSKDPNAIEEVLKIDENFNKLTTKFDTKGGSTSISARYIPIKRKLSDKNDLTPQEKTHLKASILEAVAVPGRQQLFIHVNGISTETASSIRKFVVAHVPSDTISATNVVLIATSDAAKPVSITIGTIAGGRSDLSKDSQTTREYIKAWYTAPKDAAIPMDERAFPGDPDRSK